MNDEILQELWAVKDAVAKEFDYSMDKLAEFYRKKQSVTRANIYKETLNDRAGTSVVREEEQIPHAGA